VVLGRRLHDLDRAVHRHVAGQRKDGAGVIEGAGPDQLRSEILDDWALNPEKARRGARTSQICQTRADLQAKGE